MVAKAKKGLKLGQPSEQTALQKAVTKTKKVNKSVVPTTDEVKTTPKKETPPETKDFKFTRKEAATDPDITTYNGSSTELHSVSITDPKTGKEIKASVGDDSLINRPGGFSADLVLGDYPQNSLLLNSLVKEKMILGGNKSNLKTVGTDYDKQQKFLDDIAGSLPDSTRYTTVLIPKQKDISPELVNELAAKSAKEGDLVVMTSGDAKTMNALSSGVKATGYPPGKNVVFVGRIKKGKLEPIDADELGKKIKQGKEVRDLRNEQFNAGVFENQPEKEEELAKKAGEIENKWLDRKPKVGVVKSAKDYEDKAEAWAKSMGFSGGANGYSEEATKAHDISHPIVHEMLGKGSAEINKTLGAIKDKDGKPSLVAEEGIVNVLEHLSRGDSFEASLINGLRVAKVLSRGDTKEAKAYFRSPGFRETLQKMSDDIYKNDNFNDYMALVRASNRKSGTVTNSGNKFNRTA